MNHTSSHLKALTRGSIFAAALGLACLLPVTTHAQAEVSPDFYEMANTDVTVAQQARLASNNTKPADFQGHFALPTKCAARGRA